LAWGAGAGRVGTRADFQRERFRTNEGGTARAAAGTAYRAAAVPVPVPEVCVARSPAGGCKAAACDARSRGARVARTGFQRWLGYPRAMVDAVDSPHRCSARAR